MKTPNPVLLIVLFFLLAYAPLRAQSSITPAILNSAGGSSSKDIFLEWSLGEMTTVTSVSTRQLQVSAGILQGQLVQSSPMVEARTRPGMFPNPVGNFGYLQYHAPARGIITYEITDASGKMLRKASLEHSGGAQVYKIGVQDLPHGTLYVVTRFISFSSSSNNTDLIKIVRQ